MPAPGGAVVVRIHELRLLVDGRLPFQPSLAKYAAQPPMAGDTPTNRIGKFRQIAEGVVASGAEATLALGIGADRT